MGEIERSGRARPPARQDESEPVRITTAAEDGSKDINSRERRYLISMAIRTVCFIGAVVVGPGWLRWVLVAGAVLLPYVSVIIANNRERRPEQLSLEDPGISRRELGHSAHFE